ncbi:hypothetical protein SDC9_186793 [bioreactor metagenome]|uniref:Uncharacterized protein n=1 Tax=bioreactor metagenome TaxID=1076179 RepID=A0A645HJS6_9ZZZZ
MKQIFEVVLIGPQPVKRHRTACHGFDLLHERCGIFLQIGQRIKSEHQENGAHGGGSEKIPKNSRFHPAQEPGRDAAANRHGQPLQPW